MIWTLKKRGALMTGTKIATDKTSTNEHELNAAAKNFIFISSLYTIDLRNLLVRF